MNYAFEIQESFSFLKLLKFSTHNFNPIFDVPIVSFNGVIVMFQSRNFCFDGNTKAKLGNMKK